MEKRTVFNDKAEKHIFWKEIEITETKNLTLRSYIVHSKKHEGSIFPFRTCDYVFYVFLTQSSEEQDQLFFEEMKKTFASSGYLNVADEPLVYVGFHSYAEAREAWEKYEPNILFLAENVMKNQ